MMSFIRNGGWKKSARSALMVTALMLGMVRTPSVLSAQRSKRATTQHATAQRATTQRGAAADTAGRYHTAVIRTGSMPGIRFVSGLTVCDEALVKGHWVNRYWMSTGQIKPEGQVAQAFATDAFRLVLEGQDLAGSWQWVSATQTPVHAPDGLLVTVTLTSTARPITVKLQTLLTGGPTMVRWLEIANTGKTATAITGISPWSGRIWSNGVTPRRIVSGQPVFEVATMHNPSVFHEGKWAFDSVPDSDMAIVSRAGRSGFGHPTFFAHNRVNGEWAVVSLAWSSNWTMHFHGGSEFDFELGPSTVDQALRVIDAGETVKSPETHVLLLRGDLDHAIQALHEHVRRDVLPPPIPGREYQIESNHRGYIAGHEDEAGMRREIDIGAKVGTEMFVIDAGWYGPDPNEWVDNVGDWNVGSWLPNGIKPIRDYAHKKGLLFGLWAEIEAIGDAAKLRQQHPDWVAMRDGQPLAGGRVLDMANPVVAAWAEAQIANMVQQHGIDMFRIDNNNDLDDGANRHYQGFTENTEWRHVEGLYALFDRLHQRFPNLIFQNCANGGGRMDYGMMHRFHNTEISESMRPPNGLKVLNGVTWVLPPEVLLRTYGTEAPGLEDDGDLDFQLRHVMMARPIFRGISPSVPELNPLIVQRMRASLTRFKTTIRPIMVGSNVYHHTPILSQDVPEPWTVLEYAAPKGDRDVIGLFHIAPGDSVYHLIPRGLDASRTYRVYSDNSGTTREMSGALLSQQGLNVRLDDNLSSELLIFEAK